MLSKTITRMKHVAGIVMELQLQLSGLLEFNSHYSYSFLLLSARIQSQEIISSGSFKS